MLKIVKLTDICMTGGIMHTPSHTNVCKFYIFSANIFLLLLLFIFFFYVCTHHNLHITTYNKNNSMPLTEKKKT